MKKILLSTLLTIGLAQTTLAAPADEAWRRYRTGHHAEALASVRPLAERGDAAAAFYLGSMYSDGMAVPRSVLRAADWYRKAAELGYEPAQFTLGFLYYVGAGVGADSIAADPEQAAYWLEKSARAGNWTAGYFIGTLVFEKRVGGYPEQLVRTWVLTAAEHGVAGAQFLAGVDALRRGGIDNLLDAYKWASLAAGRGYPQAAQLVETITARLNPPEVEKARNLAREWRGS